MPRTTDAAIGDADLAPDADHHGGAGGDDTSGGSGSDGNADDGGGTRGGTDGGGGTGGMSGADGGGTGGKPAACTKHTYYADQDGDDYGDDHATMKACEKPKGYVEVGGDCDDECKTCHDDGTETCDGVLDENCDGSVDERCACPIGTSRDCGTDVGECVFGTQPCTTGTWGDCEGGTAAVDEICDGLDNERVAATRASARWARRRASPAIGAPRARARRRRRPKPATGSTTTARLASTRPSRTRA
jgi:hypothetical protein